MGSQDAVISVAMEARGRDEASERPEELERREHEFGAAVEIGLGEPIDEAGLGRRESANREGDRYCDSPRRDRNPLHSAGIEAGPAYPPVMRSVAPIVVAWVVLPRSPMSGKG